MDEVEEMGLPLRFGYELVEDEQERAHDQARRDNCHLPKIQFNFQDLKVLFKYLFSGLNPLECKCEYGDQQERAQNQARRDSCHLRERCTVYRATSLIRDGNPLGPYSMTMPMALRWSLGGGCSS